MRRPRRRVRALGLLLVIAALAAGVLWLTGGRRVAYGDLASAVLTPDSLPSARYRVERVTLTTTTGRTIGCLLRSSTVARDAREATLLVAGGQGTGARAVLLLDSLFTGTAIACDYPWAPLLRAQGVALVRRLPRLRGELVATPDMLRVVAAFLATHPEADTARLVGVGASLGVPPVAAWAAGDARAKAVALVYGGADLGRVIEATFADDVPGWVPTRPLGWLAGRALRPVEPARTVGCIAPRPLLLINGADDAWIPRASVEALYAAAGQPKRLVWFTTGHMRPRNEELLRMLADSARQWIREALPTDGGAMP